MDKLDIDTLKDFYSLTKHKDNTPGALGECWQFIDEQASNKVIQALGIISGIDYLHFVPEAVKAKLPVNYTVAPVLYDYGQARYALVTGKCYPAEMTIAQLRKRAHITLENVVQHV